MAKRNEQEDKIDGLLNDPDINPYLHNDTHLCCPDMTCFCHENNVTKQQLNSYVNDGLASPADADKMYRGQTLW